MNNRGTAQWFFCDHFEVSGDRQALHLSGSPVTGFEGPFTLESLPIKLQTLGPKPVTELRIDVGTKDRWKDFRDDQWLQICKAIRACVCHLEKFSTTYACNLRDGQWAMLLRHLPPDISSLTLVDFSGDLPQTFLQLGSFRQMRHLFLRDRAPRDLRLALVGGRFCDGSFLHLAVSLKKMKHLKTLSLLDLTAATQDVEACWAPVFSAIESTTSLEGVHIGDGWRPLPDGSWRLVATLETPSTWKAPLYVREYAQSLESIRPVDPQSLRSIQFGPRINRAQLEHGGTATLEQQVEALISVREHFDCFHYFLTRIDPGTYAAAGQKQPGATRVPPKKDVPTRTRFKGMHLRFFRFSLAQRHKR